MQQAPNNINATMKALNILLIEPISKHSLYRFGRACKINDWKCTLLITKSNKLIDQAHGYHRVFQFDSLDQDKEELIHLLGPNAEYDAIIPASEFAVPISEELANALGLYHNPLELVSYYRDKSKMREIFGRYDIPQPNVIHVVTENDNLDEIPWNELPYPVVTKPSEAAGSVMVRVCYSPIEAKNAICEILQFKESRVTRLSFNNKALIEQAVLGPEYSIEVLINNNKILHSSVTTKILSNPPFCEELGHIVGNNIPDDLRQQIEFNINKLKNAWQIKNGVIHAELKVKENRLYFIEAAARVAGDMISELVELAYGLNLEEAFILTRARHSISPPTQSVEKLYAVRFIYEQRDVERMKNADFIESLDIDHITDLTQPANDFGFSSRKGRAILITDMRDFDKLHELISPQLIIKHENSLG